MINPHHLKDLSMAFACTTPSRAHGFAEYIYGYYITFSSLLFSYVPPKLGQRELSLHYGIQILIVPLLHVFLEADWAFFLPSKPISKRGYMKVTTAPLWITVCCPVQRFGSALLNRVLYCLPLFLMYLKKSDHRCSTVGVVHRRHPQVSLHFTILTVGILADTSR